MKRFPLALIGFSMWLWQVPCGHGQDAPAPAADAKRVPLAQDLAQIHQIDDDLRKKVDALCVLKPIEALSINTLEELAAVETEMKKLPT